MGNGMNKILPGLYLGNFRDARDEKQLSDNNITHIVSIHDNAKPGKSDKEYLCITASDNAAQDLSCYFSQCNDFIHKARIKEGNVLVHCLAGVSRSVTITVAYIMTVTDLTWRQCLNAVRGARRVANPNYGFQRQLMTFEHEWLSREKVRLSGAFPPSPYDDAAECHIMLKIHDQWIKIGDEVDKGKQPELYPLPHNAYNSSRESTSQQPTNQRTAAGASKTAGQEQEKKDEGQSDQPPCNSKQTRDDRRKKTSVVEECAQKQSLIDELFECMKGPGASRGNVIIYSPKASKPNDHEENAETPRPSTVYVCEGESLRLSGAYHQRTVLRDSDVTVSHSDTNHSAVRPSDVTVDDLFESSRGKPK